MVWRCSNCTFENKTSGRKCGICGADRPSQSLEDMFAQQSRSEWQCIKCNTTNNGNKITCAKCHATRTWSVESAVAQDRVLSEGAGFDCCAVYTESDKCQNTGAAGLSIAVSEGVPDPELRIVLLGRTGEGKSATGNTILGFQVFESTISPSSVTKCCKRGTCTRYERYIQVIDTPGMYDTEMSISDITREVIKCVGVTAPGPHAFVLVIKPDRFTEEVQNTIDHYMKIFGDGMLNYLIIAFTKKDDLIAAGKTIEEYLDKDSGKLQALLLRCNNRYVTFNNRGTPDEKEEDVKNLLGVIDEMVQDNGGVYISEMFLQAEKIMKEKEETLRTEHRENLERQRCEIEERCNWELRQNEEEYADITGQLQERLNHLEKQAADRSSQDAADIKKQLRDFKAEHKDKLRQIREIAGVDRETLTCQTVDYREKARKEVNDDSNFFKDTLLPMMIEVAKQVLPLLLNLVMKKIAI